jgi:aerotaxis receptor
MTRVDVSSREIAAISKLIEEIALQTNILALNAAVEAARAGDAGRGFAVVAGEVRSLAQRSAKAAHEVKELIGSSTHQVEAGTALVAEAGQAMNGIVTQVKRVSDLIGEMSAATQELSGGIVQVGQAVHHMDHVTQQNAALVEESAVASDCLSQQAHKLSQAVGVFSAEGAQPQPVRRAPVQRRAVAATAVATAAQGPATPARHPLTLLQMGAGSA